MKKIYLLFLGLSCASFAYGQKTEYSFHLNSGLSKFGGESSTEYSSLSGYISPDDNGITTDSYGRKYAFSYGASVQVQRVTGRNLVFGVGIGVDALRSKVSINRVHYDDGRQSTYPAFQPAEGRTIFLNNFVNLYPYLGQRLNTGVFDVDITLGADVSKGIGSREKGKATTQGGDEFTSNRERSVPSFDFRPRLGIAAYRGQVGASVSYAHGLKNYMANWDGGNPEAYTRVLRAGLLYRL